MQMDQRGAALVIVMLVMASLTLAGTAGLLVVDTTLRDTGAYIAREQAFNVAEAGLNKALWWYRTNYGQPDPSPNGLDTTQAPVRWGSLPVDFPGNHSNSTYTDTTGTVRTAVVTGTNGFTPLLANQAFGGGTFTVTARMTNAFTPGGTMDEAWLVTSTGTYRGQTRTITAKIKRPLTTLFTDVGFAKDEVKCSGDGATDSYDSSLGSYALTSTASSGNVGSNAAVKLSGNCRINGNATPGPTSSVEISGGASVSGSTASRSQTKVLPPLASFTTGSEKIQNTCTITYSSTTCSGVTVSDGVITIKEVKLSGSDVLTIDASGGPITINMEKYETSGTAQTTITNATTTNKVTLNVLKEVKISGNGLVNSGSNPSPGALAINLGDTSECDTNCDMDDDTKGKFELSGTAAFYGTVYAPGSKVKFTGNANFYGSMVAKKIKMSGNGSMHYDKALGNGKDVPGAYAIFAIHGLS